MFCYLYIYASPSKNIEDIHSLMCTSSPLFKVTIPIGKNRIPTIFFQLLNLGSSYTLDFRSGRKRLWRRTQVVGLWCCQACAAIAKFSASLRILFLCHKFPVIGVSIFFVDGWNISYFFCNLMDGYSYSVIFVCPSTRFCTKLNLFNRSSGSW